MERQIALGHQRRGREAGFVGLVRHGDQQAAAAAQPAGEVEHLAGQADLFHQPPRERHVGGQMPHPANRLDVLATSKRLERRRVAGAHPRIDITMQRPQPGARQLILAGVHLGDEVVEARQLPRLDLPQQLFQGDVAGADHQAEVGDIILVVGRERMVFRRDERGVGPPEGRLIERRAQRVGHGRFDRRHARPINRGVVAAARAQRGLVNIHDHRGARIQRRAFGQHPVGKLGQGGPTVGRENAVLDIHGQRLIALRADEGPAAPAARRAHVAKRVAVGQRRVAQVNQLGQLGPHAIEAATAAEEPGQYLREGRVLFARSFGAGHPHLGPGLVIARNLRIHRA